MGRGNAYAVAVQTLLLLLAPLLNDRAYGVIHTVGGASGWDLGVDYKSWAAGQTFKVGDVLFFPYLQSEHDVVVVSKAGYDSCSAANALATYSAGNDNVTLTSAGAHYYLCSVVGHCAGGMKLAVTIGAAAAPVPVSTPARSHAVPVPSPAATMPPVSPAPSPTAPPSAPVPAPATVSPVPAPATVSPVPAPAPVPASAPAAPSSATPAPSSAPTPSTTPIIGSPPAPSSPSSSPNAAGPLLAAAVFPSLPLISALLLTAL